MGGAGLPGGDYLAEPAQASCLSLNGGRLLNIEVHADAAAVSRRAAAWIAALAGQAIEARGRFVLAVSGGTTPWQTLRLLAEQAIAWQRVQVVQVDERVAAAGSPERNLTHLQQALLARAPLSAGQVHAMPVEDLDLDRAAKRYGAVLTRLTGTPATLDLVCLGLGPDGHTASLVPGDAALDVDRADVAVTGPYQGRRRMTLSFPMINRARRILWLVTGEEKAEVLARLVASDPALPAGRINQAPALLIADRAAAARLAPGKGDAPGPAEC